MALQAVCHGTLPQPPDGYLIPSAYIPLYGPPLLPSMRIIIPSTSKFIPGVEPAACQGKRHGYLRGGSCIRTHCGFAVWRTARATATGVLDVISTGVLVRMLRMSPGLLFCPL